MATRCHESSIINLNSTTVFFLFVDLCAIVLMILSVLLTCIFVTGSHKMTLKSFLESFEMFTFSESTSKML